MFPLWNFFLSRRQFTYLLIAGLVLAGVASAIVIRKESSPEVEVPIGIVVTALPGASSTEVESLVTNKIEKQLSSLSDVDKITSSSGDGISVVTVQYVASADIDSSIRKLKDEVDKVKPELPEEAKDPSVSNVNFSDQPVLIVSVSADLPFGQFAALGDTLKDELQAIPGVSRVEVQGARPRETQVIVRKEDLARYGLSLGDVSNAIRAANAALPAGKITVDDVEYSVRFAGDLTDPKDVGLIGIPTRTGAIIYVRDIATIADGVESATTLTRLSKAGAPSEQALTLNIFKGAGADVTKVADGVRTKLTELQSKPVLAGSSVVVSFDAGEQVNKDLGELVRVGIETVLLVALCLFITIGWRESLVAGISVPLSFLISFVGLYYSGNTINFVSLFSLILAIGILVDAGIVIVEGMSVRLARHHDPLRAARETVREFSWPLIAGTATTVGVFVPLFFISGITGEFIKSIPFTIIAVLIASTFVALGILPLLATLFVKETHAGRLGELQDRYANLARSKYESFLRHMFAQPRLQKYFLWGIALAFLASLALPIFGLVKVEFFPGGGAEFVYLDLEMPEGTPLAQTDLAMRAVEERLYEHKEFESIITTVGTTNQFSGAASSGSRFANALILLSDKDTKRSTDVVNRLRAQMADMTIGTIRVGEPAGGPPTGAPILIKFTGDDLGALAQASEKTANILGSMEGVADVRSSGDAGGTEFVLTADRAKLASLGLTPVAIAQTLRSAIYGVEATKIRTFGDDISVTVRANLNPTAYGAEDASRATFDAIKQIPIATADGQVLLGSLVNPTLAKGQSAIAHEGRKRIMTVSATLKSGENARDTLAAFMEKSKTDLALPDGVVMSTGGENEETNQSFMEMFFAFIAGIVIMYAVVVLEFNSFRLAGYTLMIVPLSITGVLLGLLITFKPLSFPSLLGLIALGGVIINHAIILIDSFISPLRSTDDGTGPRSLDDFIVRAASSRLRPIFLTTVTTAVGMIPLSFASALWAPLAFTIMFGLIFGTVLTLVFIPVMLHRKPGKGLEKMFAERMSAPPVTH